MSALPRLLVSALALALLGGCASHAGKNPAAPKDPMQLAQLLRDNGRMAAAYEIYARAERRNLLSPAQRLDYAEVGAQLLPPQQALPLYVKARQQMGDSGSAEQRFALCLGIGRGQLALGQLPAARESFDCALKARPDSTEALNALAITDSAEGNSSGAEARLRHVLELDPANSAALNNLAMNLLSNGRPADAIDLLKGTELRGRPTLVLNLALAHLRQGDIASARSTLQQYLPQISAEPLLNSLRQSAARMDNPTDSARELLAASRQPLPLDPLP
ncbi:MAG: Beta-barrel assembly-enhancing protease [Pseudomonas citronellolis]|nr:MAG: Beta-barrel assembly-enhancing protease [Pseudomonas citronellolis]